MANASTYLESAVLNHVLRNVAFTSPPQVFLALYLSDPTDADTGTEVTGGGYVRQRVIFDAPVASGGESTASNSQAIEFPVATTPWGNVIYFGIKDAATGGSLLLHGSLLRSRDIQVGDQIRFDVGALTLAVV